MRTILPPAPDLPTISNTIALDDRNTKGRQKSRKFCIMFVSFLYIQQQQQKKTINKSTCCMEVRLKMRQNPTSTVTVGFWLKRFCLLFAGKLIQCVLWTKSRSPPPSQHIISNHYYKRNKMRHCTYIRRPNGERWGKAAGKQGRAKKPSSIVARH